MINIAIGVAAFFIGAFGSYISLQTTINAKGGKIKKEILGICDLKFSTLENHHAMNLTLVSIKKDVENTLSILKELKDELDNEIKSKNH